MRVSWIAAIAVVLLISGWYAAGPGSGYLYGVEFGCIDAAWRRHQGKPCERFEWERTIRYRVDVAGNRVIAFPTSGRSQTELATLPDCSVYDLGTWRCADRASAQTVTDGLYVRASSAALLNSYEEYGSTRFRDVARYLVGASPPDPSSWR